MSKPNKSREETPDLAPAPEPAAVPAKEAAANAALAAYHAERAKLDAMLLTPHDNPEALHAQHYVVAGCEERLKAAREAAFKGPV